MTDTLTNTAAVARLIVLSGLHAGAWCELSEGECSIGSGVTDAVILSDPGIAFGHLLLDVQGASATIHPAHGGMTVNGMDLSPGEPAIAALPFELTLAGVALRCEAEQDEARDVQDDAPADAARPSPMVRLLPLLKSAWRLPAVAFTVLAPFVIAPAMSSVTPDTEKAGQPVAELAVTQGLADPTETADPASLMVASKLSVTPEPPPSLLADAVRELQAELAARSLSDIQLTASDGLIMARGQLAPQSEAEWRRLHQWFDGRYSRYGREATLVDEVRFNAVPLPKIAVDAVWTGRNPNVVIKGQRFFEGATLPNGFQLERISPGVLLVVREGQRMALKF